jgi:hypothetical protein
MKRDMDLVRRILLTMEAEAPASGTGGITIDGYDAESIAYHVIIMGEAGLLVVIDESTFANIDAIPVRLTWAGHEFIESVRDEAQWKTVKTQAEKAGGLVFEVVKSVASALMLRQLGL